MLSAYAGRCQPKSDFFHSLATTAVRACGHICGGIDFDPRFCHAFSHEIGAPDRFWHAFGPFGPRPYGVSQKAISY
jgi:hypothetical protein